MTNLDLEKEAERIIEYLDQVPMRKDYRPKYLLAALRAVHDAALEGVLLIGDDNKPEFHDIHPQLHRFLEKVRAFKISPDGSGIGDGK